MKEEINITCRYGKFCASISQPENGMRAICYCKDCQMYAHFLKSPNDILNSMGGTEVIAIRPQQLSIRAGIELLSCMRLKNSGPYRWYTCCCYTPLCNMRADIHTAHISLICSFIDVSRYPLKKPLHINRKSGYGSVPKNSSFTFIKSTLRYFSSVTLTKVTRQYRKNPLVDFNAGLPIVTPKILTEIEYENLKSLIIYEGE